MERMHIQIAFWPILLQLLAFSVAAMAQQTANRTAAPGEQRVILYVGTFSVRGAEGIYVYEWDLATGDFVPVQTVPGRESPSFLTVHPNGKFLYSVQREGVPGKEDAGSVAAWSIEPGSGRLAFLNEQSSLGGGACHVNTDAEGKLLFVANYGGGDFTVYPLEENGRVGEHNYHFQYQGSGPNTSRQDKPHLHSAMPAPDNRYVFAADLGTDRLYAYRMNPGKGKLRPAKTPWATIEPGGGPRHFVFHPNGRWAYVAEELAASVTAFRYQSRSGQMEPVQRLSTLPAGYAEASYCADIHVHPNGKFLYVSNRGHNSLAVFSIDQETGRLALIDTPAVQGDWPRNFLISPDGRWCLVANERSDNAVLFSIDQDTGKLTYTGKELKIPSPVCLKVGRIY